MIRRGIVAAAFAIVVGCQASHPAPDACLQGDSADALVDFAGVGGIVTADDGEGHVQKLPLTRGDPSLPQSTPGCVVKTDASGAAQIHFRLLSGPHVYSMLRVRCLMQPGGPNTTVLVDISIYGEKDSELQATGEVLSVGGTPETECKSQSLSIVATTTADQGEIEPVGRGVGPATSSDFKWSYHAAITGPVTTSKVGSDPDDAGADAGLPACTHPLTTSIALDVTYDSTSYAQTAGFRQCF